MYMANPCACLCVVVFVRELTREQEKGTGPFPHLVQPSLPPFPVMPLHCDRPALLGPQPIMQRKVGSPAAATPAKGSELALDVVQSEDVAAEAARAGTITDYEANPIVIKELRKIYPGLDGQPPKVQGVVLGDPMNVWLGSMLRTGSCTHTCTKWHTALQVWVLPLGAERTAATSAP